jgi:hypothetical protein
VGRRRASPRPFLSHGVGAGMSVVVMVEDATGMVMGVVGWIGLGRGSRLGLGQDLGCVMVMAMAVILRAMLFRWVGTRLPL